MRVVRNGIACIGASLHALGQDRGGNVMIVVGLGIFVLLGSLGSAIDMGRAQMAQARLSSALDSAGLAAGGVINSGNVSQVATKYFNANFPSSYMGGVTLAQPISVVENTDKTMLTLTANATVPTTFMGLLGFDTMPISASTEITRAKKGMELVLVMDVTGSMEEDNKIGAMKTAAKDLVDILYGDKTTVDNLWIGLVPFSQTVNIGASRTGWVTTDSFNYGTSQTWKGCVDAREASGRDITDDPPATAKFPRYFWICDNTATSMRINNKTHNYSLNGWNGKNSDEYSDDSFDSSKMNCATGSGFGYKTPYKDGTADIMHYGPNRYCPSAVTPMTSNKATIVAGINAMTPGGNTHVNLGAVWGWRMLSPRWRTLWGGEMNTNSLPLNYNAPLMNKVIIILTDGENTMSNSARGAYWYLKDNKLGTTSSSTAVTRLNQKLTSVCNSMKVGPNAATPNNIIVYTIAFGNPGSTIETLLKNCASKPDYFFDSPTNEDLKKAFRIIGDSLANLRVSK